MSRRASLLAAAGAAAGTALFVAGVVWPAGAAHASEARAIDPAGGLAAALPVRPYAGAVPAVAPAVTPAVVPAAGGGSPLPPLRWEVRTQDITLSHTLERWAADAGYRVKWDAARNFLIGAPDAYEGSFEVALQAVLGSAGIRESDYPLEACVYANHPPLVRITRQGEQAKECRLP